ncbi:MAG: kynureninase [Rubrivivax sp.]|nr:kynureninase [Rubrivivax sp.]
MTLPWTRATLEQRDRDDLLAAKRACFALPEGVIYLDGNSLGALVASVPARLERAVRDEWGQGLIRSWNEAGWYPAPQRVGAAIARLVGAAPQEVVACDSTSVNLFKVLVSAMRLRPGRRLILGELGNFPTDMYVAQSVADLMGGELLCVEPEDVEAEIARAGDRLAVVTLTQVNYKTGRVHDMARITRAAHAVGGLTAWDLAHSAGTLPVQLRACEADFAVGCGYKYLNGGPGAPAFVFVAERHLPAVQQPLAGWHGHAQPFAFTHGYTPHPGIDRMLVGTAPQLSLIALEEALGVFADVDMAQLRHKGSELGDAFIALVDQELAGHGFGLASPREAAQRGSQVSLTHPQGYAIMQALIARGVIGDFRAPDILRFGFAGLYVRHVDIWDAVATLKAVMSSGEWNQPAFLARKAVT